MNVRRERERERERERKREWVNIEIERGRERERVRETNLYWRESKACREINQIIVELWGERIDKHEIERIIDNVVCSEWH